MKYRVKPEHLSEWGSETALSTIITDDDLLKFSIEWEKNMEELKNQLIEEKEVNDMSKLFEGYYNNKAVEIALGDDMRVYILDKVTGDSECWNDEYYTEEDYNLVLESMTAEGFERE